eukprot:3941937-Rhodomonas_salina.1
MGADEVAFNTEVNLDGQMCALCGMEVAFNLDGLANDATGCVVLTDGMLLRTQVYSWHDKYRPRKPRFFNRVGPTPRPYALRPAPYALRPTS